MNRNQFFIVAMAIALVLCFTATAVPFSLFGKPSEEKIEQDKADIRQKSKETLERLYDLMPSARKAISNAAGYAVFSEFGMKLGVAGGGSGKGIAVDNRTRKETFMKMVEVQAGLGLGIKKFNLIWVFENQNDLNQFINSGWELSAQTTGAAKMGDKGGSFSGATSVNPGVWLYQLTDAGLALELTAKETKYYKDGDLN